MNIDKPIGDQVQFLPGDICYMKQDILNNRDRLTVNGTEVDHFHLQKAYVIVSIQIEIINKAGGYYRYLLRPQRTFSEEDKIIGVHDTELLSRDEALAIVRLRASVER